MSITTDINNNLFLIGIGCCILLAGMLLHRIARILCYTLITGLIFIQTTRIKSPLQNFAHKGLVAQAIQFIAIVINSILRLLITSLKSIFLIFYTLLPFIILSMCLVILQQRWGETILVLVDTFNGSLGSTLRTLILTPLYLLDLLGTYALPAINLVIYIIFQGPLQLLIWILKGNGLNHLLAAIQNIGDAFPLLSQELQNFVIANSQSCQVSSMTCVNTTFAGVQCSNIDTSINAKICLDPAKRELLLDLPFEKLRVASGHTIMVVGTSCEALGLIANVTMYPIIDPKFWKALDNTINALLFSIVGAPSSAILRCQLAGGFINRPSMCTPDFGHTFELIAEAGKNLGVVITNWANMLYLIIFNRDDIGTACDVNLDFKSVWQDPILNRMVASNATALVRMSSSTFGLTDGNSVLYVQDRGQLKRTYSPLAWPVPVDPKNGIARIIFPNGVDVKDGGIGLFGCSCNDSETTLLNCHAITKGGNSWDIPIRWSLSSETQLLKCDRIRIVVQSIRWPQQRVVVSQFSTYVPTCRDSATCLVGDIAIYVVPICGSSNGFQAMACFPEKLFTRGICFPYCLGLHMQHEGLQPIVMRGAAEWENGVIIAKRDCVPKLTETMTIATKDSSDVMTRCSILADTTGKIIDQTTNVQSFETCTYDYTCTTSILNKSNYVGYSSSSTAMSYINTANTQNGVRLTLSKQPLVIASGVQMRIYSVTGNDGLDHKIADFPTIVGNQYNEFTVEPNSPIGVPVTSASDVPSLGISSERQGFIYPPPEYVQGKIPYNPAVLSMEALWYVTNPSYNWAYAFINYCATEGYYAPTDIILFSSYPPMRIWRIQYQNGGCYISSSGGNRVCSDDIATAASIDIAREFPHKKSNANENNGPSIYSLCESKTEFNLWVESLEDFNEQNIVIAVRRGTTKHIASLLSDNSQNIADKGKTVYYFVNKSNVSNIRENIPWKLNTQNGPASDIFWLSCPALNVLPDIGSIFGYSIASVSYLFRVPVNFILNPFAITELIKARSLGSCPEDSLLHSALEECGMKLFSLTDLFDAVYKSNHAFWELIAWIASIIAPAQTQEDGNPSNTDMETFHSFLQGSAVLADATQIITLYDVVRVVENFDTGAQEAVLGNRRRLLSFASKAYTAGSRAGGAGKSMLGFTAGHVKFGVSSLLSLTKLVGSVVTGAPFAGADIGMLLSSQDPNVNLIGSAVSAPAIAWAQLTYEIAVPMILDILASAQSGKFSFAPFWVNIHQSLGKYHEIITERHHQACTGIRLMLGYSSTIGKGVYYNCLAGADMTDGMILLTLNIFVDLRLYKCMCINPAGEDYKSYVYSNCVHLIPSSRKAFWQNTLLGLQDNVEGSVQLMCSAYMTGIQQQLYSNFDSWTDHALLSAQYLASFLDEILSNNPKTKGDCANILSNPTAMILTPLPVSHYHVCAKTSICRLRCSDSIQLFEFELNRLNRVGYNKNIPQQTFDVNTESPIFNRYATNDGKWDSNDMVIALKSQSGNESSSCEKKCGIDGRCITALIQRDTLYNVNFFCIPNASMILSTLYSVEQDKFDVSSSINDMVINQGVTITNIEFALQNETNYLFVYVSRPKFSKSMDGTATQLFSHEIHIFKPDGNGGSTSQMILRSEDLQASMLTPLIQQSFFGGSIIKSQVSGCSIISVVDVASGIDGKVVLFLSFVVQMKAWTSPEVSVDGQASEIIQKGYTIHSIFHWCDKEVTFAEPCNTDIVFYPPCSESCISLSCGGTCHAGLDAVIMLANQGVFMYISNMNYFFLPSMSSENSDSTNIQAGIVTIDPYSGITQTKNTFSFATASGGGIFSPFSKKFPLATTSNNIANLGSWNRGRVFSVLSSMTKITRDIMVHDINKGQIPYFFQLSGSGSINTEWIVQVRTIRIQRGWELKLFKSQQVSRSVPVNINCTFTSCGGCSTARLRLLCHDAQNCALTKCIGKVVQTKNVLCGIGQVTEQTSTHAILTWRAMYLSLTEMGLLLVRNTVGESIRKISLKFPTDQFYTLICSCKDMYATVVALGTSVVQSFLSTATSTTTQGNLDLTGRQDVGALVGETTLKAASMAGFFFNAISGSTLLPTLALHRWLICMANVSGQRMTEDEGTISIQFGDLTMDQSWLACAQVGGMADMLNSADIQSHLSNTIEIFVSFALSLISGIGETILYALQLSFDCSIDLFVGLVWSLQDILYTFNLRSCKVPNYALRYVMWCSCNDTAYVIPNSQRSEKLENGALWCVGTLSMTLVDGTTDIIYNPYTLQELSAGVQGVALYINCLSSTARPSDCVPPIQTYTLSKLMDQNVEPIAVWARCKSNYQQSTWDVGSGYLFSPDLSSLYPTKNIQDDAIKWATTVGPEFLQCMRDPERLHIDYSTCMRMYFDIAYNRTPNSYFLYEPASPLSTEPPDACLVFSGLRSSASRGSPIQNLMTDCSLQEGVGQTSKCDLNPLVWSGNQPLKVPAASLHGVVPPQIKLTGTSTSIYDNIQTTELSKSLYNVAKSNLQKAYEVFNKTYGDEVHQIDAALFSADGDFIHDFFDCVFLGPYTRTDIIPCDREELIDCPFYARDDLGGSSRYFTPCFGDIMYNDHNLPFTCGSQARRSIIKYFFRNYSHATNGKELSKNISSFIAKKVSSIFLNYTSDGSLGCYDPITNTCNLNACSGNVNGYAPCMDVSFEIPSEDVADFVIQTVLRDLDKYYQYTLQDTIPWTYYYNVSGPSTAPQVPFQWGKNSKYTSIAVDQLHHFDPSIPLVKFDQGEVYNMPSSSADENNRTSQSIWGLCMALLSQPAMTIPIDVQTNVPIGAWNNLNKLDMTDINQVETIVRNITSEAIKSNNPFVWHKAKRHAPSHSTICKKKENIAPTTIPHKPGKLSIGSVSITLEDQDFIVRPSENFNFPLFGFSQSTIGDTAETCICALKHDTAADRCVITKESCASFAEVSIIASNYSQQCSHIKESCEKHNGIYDKIYVDQILECLRSLPKVRCPELGPSDIWGLYPVDCTHQECETASTWIGTGARDINFEGSRFLNEGRAGLRLPNYKHVNNTYHEAIHYAEKSRKTSESQQPRCFETSELSQSSGQEDASDLLDDFVSKLFPASQLIFDSQSTAVCSRYIIEVARSEAMKYISSSSSEASLLQVASWKRKCESKVRHLSMCKMYGIYYDVLPPTNWKTIAKENGNCAVNLYLPLDEKGNERFYLTPWCILVDRVNQRMYDANLCVFLANKLETNTLNDLADISTQCALVPQPLSILQENGAGIALSMIFTEGKRRILESKDWIAELSTYFDFSNVDIQSTMQNEPARDHVSHVLDWWPTDVPMPTGYHPTASTDPSELAPALFDSHYLYDSELNVVHYVHSTLRNSSLHFDTAGASGVCRATNVNMPMFKTNTNRLCTRMAFSSSEDTPTMPVQTPKSVGSESEEWPFSKSFIDKYFKGELCGSSEYDTPWSSNKFTDPQSQTLGGIPGWQTYVSMNSQGGTQYDTSSDRYPPLSYPLLDLKQNEDEMWGKCANTVRWGIAPTCSTLNTNECHQDISTCLKLYPSTNNTYQTPISPEKNGICYSMAAYTRSLKQTTNTQNYFTGIRQPCFSTEHCPDGMVCLADGGCSPLFLHMWNDHANTQPLEFSVIADSCGFKDNYHPYTQKTRGASPWEHVPDILHSHGFCSHRNWFSYRHSIRTNLCPLNYQTNGDKYMSCNSTQTSWPWVFERFNTKRTTSNVHSLMSEDSTLLAKPHPCDDKFMHLQTPPGFTNEGKRMEMCSGYQGRELLSNTNVYQNYDLNQEQTWDNTSPNIGTGDNSQISRWMRTYSETTGLIDIGVFQETPEHDVPMGFLGANYLEDGVFGDMALGTDKINFFRCSDKLACTNPPFTYNGVSLNRKDPISLDDNFTETSLRLCGSIGYIPNWRSTGLCSLDMAMFPILHHLLWPEQQELSIGCQAIWPQNKFLAGFVILINNDIESIDQSNFISLTSATSAPILCEKNIPLSSIANKMGRCVYASRSSTRLSNLNEQDSINIITTKLNQLLRLSGDSILQMRAIPGNTVTRVYEHINKCMAALMETIITTQSNLQSSYGTLGPSGLYFAYRVALYEFPLYWLHHAMLVTLLSDIDSKVQAPLLTEMGIGKIDLMLWNEEDRSICNSRSELNFRSVLWTIICNNAHPEYTFSFGSGYSNFYADQLSNNIKMKAQTDIQNKLILSTGQMSIFCYKQASWDCIKNPSQISKCRDAMIYAHNVTYCEQDDGLNGNEWLDPCFKPDHFSLSNEVEVTMEKLTSNMPSDSAQFKDLNLFLSNTRKNVLLTIESLINPIDVLKEMLSDVVGGAGSLDSTIIPIVRLWPIQKLKIEQATSGFNLSNWLNQDVCWSKYDPRSVCSSQYETTSTDQCLYYSDELNMEDLNRYQMPTAASETDSNGYLEPTITLTYASEDKETINICDMPDEGICITQYPKNSKFSTKTDQVIDGIVPCDIISIKAPPGVHVQVFALKLSNSEWNNINRDYYEVRGSPIQIAPDRACSTEKLPDNFGDQKIFSCSWRESQNMEDPTPNSWMFNGSNDATKGSPSYIVSGFGELNVDFSDMGVLWKNSGYQNYWSDEGCKAFGGICSLKIKLEDNPNNAKSICQPVVPNCANIMKSDSFSTFTIVNSTSSRNSLYRCAPCTKAVSTISSDGLFGCFISDKTKNTRTSEEILTYDSISQSVPYLQNSNLLASYLQVQTANGFLSAEQKSNLANGSALDILVSLNTDINPTIMKSLIKWGKLATFKENEDSTNVCSGTSPSACWKGFDSSVKSKIDFLIWQKAILNPNMIFTMMCKTQTYTEKDFQQCNPKADVRRQKLAQFVQSRYRKQNGIWMQTVNVGKGVAWQANVAHSSVGMFSIMYASTNRKSSDVLCKWILGQEPCSSAKTVFQDRICIESTQGNGGNFQPMHPWIGGDFNPFEGNSNDYKIRGFDECPSTSSSSRGVSICPCKCEPKWACEDSSGIFNYTESTMAAEFPDSDSCANQEFSKVRVMESTDESNICSMARDSILLPKQCLHQQGLLGGLTEAQSITADELHGDGIKTTNQDFLIQSLYEIGNNGLWGGQTLLQEANLGQKYAFLKMTRDKIHPAHVAFGLDMQKTGNPLVVKAISLLPYPVNDNNNNNATTFNSNNQPNLYWVTSLKNQWDQDRLIVKKFYPQLWSNTEEIGDWSCPFKAFTFWGGNVNNFSPLVPNPILSDHLYNIGGGIHPLTKVKSLQDKLAKYKTTNGACFYEEGVPITNVLVSDAHNPCGIKGMLKSLNEDTGNIPVISRVVNHFSKKCDQIMDTPDLDVTLRSGENLLADVDPNSKCGVLHRLTPFLMSIKGNAGKVQKDSSGLTTSSEGGDCHMGRSFLYSSASGYRENVAGRYCYLIEKNNTHGTSSCPQKKDILPSTITFLRAKPLTLGQITKKGKRFYRIQMGQTSVPVFFGPGKVRLQEPEVSFGLLYSVSLKRNLAGDLQRECKLQPTLCTLIKNENEDVSRPLNWLGTQSFLFKYNNGLLTKNNNSIGNNTKKLTPVSLENEIAYSEALKLENDLWNKSDWTWSFITFNNNISKNDSNNTQQFQRHAKGTVDKSKWLKNRFGACNDSYHKYAYSPNSMDTTIRSITLCEPAPTASLQTLCQAMLQYRTDIANINCQIMGGKDCLFQPGMFYMPYMWSNTNQEFMADTVLQYYSELVAQPRFSNETFTKLCPARNNLLEQLATLSRQQATQCPGSQIEYLKVVLNSIKKIGKDILYMGYCLVMFVVNALACAFADDGASFTAMSRLASTYLTGFLDTAMKILMPILDTIVKVLFGTSSVGKIISEALHILCEMYNFFMDNVFRPIWCIIVRPALFFILKPISALVNTFDKTAAGKIDDVLAAISGGDGGISISDTAACFGSFVPHVECSKKDDSSDDNTSKFLIQPVATRCWVDSMTNGGGGSVLSGSSGNSYLSCTVSDTCAVDPLKFDSYDDSSDLIACASCPPVPIEEMAQRFGCNTYLKRCTCGIRSRNPSECISNSDCQSQSSICSISSNIDTVRQSFTSLPCSECGGLGSEPVCIMDGAQSTGVCSCVPILQSNILHTCDSSITGKIITLVTPGDQCFVSFNKDIKSIIQQNPNLVLDFNTLSIASCALGTSSAACVYVQLPSSSGGQYSKTFAVILGITNSGSISDAILNVGGRRRRLLQIESYTDDGNVSYNSSNTTLNNFISKTTLENDPQKWNWSAIPKCSKIFIRYNTSNIIMPWSQRQLAKWCIHWMITANTMVNMFYSDNNETDGYNIQLPSDTQHSSKVQEVAGALLSPLKFANICIKYPKLLLFNLDTTRFFIKQHEGLLPVLIDATWDIASNSLQFISTSLMQLRMSTTNHNGSGGFHNNSRDFPTKKESANKINNDDLKSEKHSRKLLSWIVNASEIINNNVNDNNNYALPIQQCSALEVPIKHIASAFWDTVHFYRKQMINEQDLNYTINDNNSSDNQSWMYVLPPQSMTDNTFRGKQQGNGAFGDIINNLIINPFMSNTVGGQFVDAIVSDISYNETIENNYITGRRVLSELSYCNYTSLTFGPRVPKPLLPWVLLLFVCFVILTSLCSLSPVISWMAWIILFPMILFWAVYNISPLCWPMIPPKLPHDLYVELGSLVPNSIKIPSFLIQIDCTDRGLLSDGTYDPRCFKQCSQEPFLMLSWQDPLAWWLCDISTNMCQTIGKTSSLWGGVFQDFASSTQYYSEVIAFGSQDADFVAAHRLCAFFMSYEIVFAFIALALAVFVIPSICQAIIEIFSGAVVMLFYASGAEITDE